MMSLTDTRQDLDNPELIIKTRSRLASSAKFIKQAKKERRRLIKKHKEILAKQVFDHHG